MNNKLKQHDPLVRKHLSNIEVAKDFLDIHLPLEIKSRCDLSSVVVESGSYIDDDLKTHCSDIVYKLKLLTGDQDSCIYVYTLIEHQSSPEVLMPLRILRYQLAIIQKHLDNKKVSNDHKLPLVVPLVLYNGRKSPYPYSCNIAELFEHRELYQTIPLGLFKLVDLTVLEDDEILKHRKLALLEMITKHIYRRDFVSVIELVVRVLQIAHKNELDVSLVMSAVNYLGKARDEDEVKPLFAQIKDNAPYYEGVVMSYAETLKQEGVQLGKQEGLQLGKQEGLQLGKQEGLQLGKQEAQKEIAQQLLKSGVDNAIIIMATHLTKVEVEELRKSLH